MPEYTCRVATSAGEVLLRSYVADDERALRRQLEGQDLMVLDLRRRNALLQSIGGLTKLRGAVSIREFLIFNQELAALLRAGLPIIGSLEILTERRKNQAFKRALLDIRERVKSGESLSDAFRAQEWVVPESDQMELPEGHFYRFAFEGMAAVDSEGRELGQPDALMNPIAKAF